MNPEQEFDKAQEEFNLRQLDRSDAVDRLAAKKGKLHLQLIDARERGVKLTTSDMKAIMDASIELDSVNFKTPSGVPVRIETKEVQEAYSDYLMKHAKYKVAKIALDSATSKKWDWIKQRG